MTALQRQWRTRLTLRTCVFLSASALILYAAYWSEFNLEALSTSGPRFEEFFTRLVPPDWSVTMIIIRSIVETLAIALVGTAVAAVVSLPLGFLAASNVSPAWISQPIKFVLGFIRAIPLIVVALIFVFAVGLGPFPGALAIAFHSIGMLGKFYAEEFETADGGILNAVRGTGANWLQTLRFGLFPQSVPQLVSFTIYRFEMNFRDATVLGLVGAGGIGYYIQLYVLGYQWEKVAVLLVLLVAVVTLMDQFTFWTRRAVQ